MTGPEYCHSSLKRALDLAICLGAFPLTSPIWLAMWIYNRYRSQPLLFHQERTGAYGTSIFIAKYETLYSGAENEEFHLASLNYIGPDRELVDPRVPNRILRAMRSSGLNEIPQLINVAKGEMSIVGPRPLPVEFISGAKELFPDLLTCWNQTALTIKPGMVGTDPLNTRRLPISKFDQIAKGDIKYFETASLLTDLSIMADALLAISRVK